MLSKYSLNHSRVSSGAGIWLLILGIIFAAATLRAPLTGVGSIIETIRRDTGISNALAGMLTTLPLLAFALFSPIAPKMARRFGLENTLFGAMIILAAGIFLRSVPFIQTMFFGTALIGLAIAVCNVLLPSLIKRDFPNKIGLMTGTYSVSMNLWAAIASGVSIPITQGLGLGWRYALASWSVLSIIAIVFWLPQLRPFPAATGIEEKRVSLWRSGLAWKVALFMGLQSTAFYTVVAWLPVILHQQGLSHSASGWLLSLAQFSSLPLTFVITILAGRQSNQRYLVVIITIFLITGYIGIISGFTSMASLFVMLIGIGIGSAFALANMFFILRTHNANQAAELSGMAQSVGYLLAAVAPALFGYIVDQTDNWTIPLIILIVLAVLMFIAGMGAGSNKHVTPQGEKGRPGHDVLQ